MPPCRYGGLKSLGEKKAAFNEYVQQRKKEEAEEARQKRLQVTAELAAATHRHKGQGFLLGAGVWVELLPTPAWEQGRSV